MDYNTASKLDDKQKENENEDEYIMIDDNMEEDDIDDYEYDEFDP